jgi:hypothetical protein
VALYLDVHRGVNASIDELAKAHVSDLEAQERYGVKYLKYWFNQAEGTVFCLVEGPDREACNAVHREAHGLVAEKLIDVESHLLEAFLGGSGESPYGAALWPDGTLDGGLRTIVFTDLVGSTWVTTDSCGCSAVTTRSSATRWRRSAGARSSTRVTA